MNRENEKITSRRANRKQRVLKTISTFVSVRFWEAKFHPSTSSSLQQRGHSAVRANTADSGGVKEPLRKGDIQSHNIIFWQ